MSYDFSGKPIASTGFGLIKSQGKSSGLPTRKPVIGSKRPPLTSIFGRDALEDDDDDDLEGGTDRKNEKDAFIKRANKIFSYQQSATANEATKLHASALEEDVNIFDYDGSYDSFKQESERKIASNRLNSASSTAPTAKYIQDLKNASLVREKEKERIFEKKLLKERSVQGETARAEEMGI
jgi:hypothetical protein